MIWLEKIRDKVWDDTGGNGRKEDQSLQLLGQGCTMEREKEKKKEREKKKRETQRKREIRVHMNTLEKKIGLAN